MKQRDEGVAFNPWRRGVATTFALNPAAREIESDVYCEPAIAWIRVHSRLRSIPA